MKMRAMGMWAGIGVGLALMACGGEADAPSTRTPAEPDPVAATSRQAPDEGAVERDVDDASRDPSAQAHAEDRSPDVAADDLAIIDHTVDTLEGERVSLGDYRGDVLLIVNTASQCGYTPQYAGLQILHERYGDQGLRVLAFPSNDFGEQEPGTPSEIRRFVHDDFQVGFAMFDKVAVKGDAKAAVYETLTEETRAGIRGDVKWNFTKFLVDEQGRVVARFEPKTAPLDAPLIEAIEAELAK